MPRVTVTDHERVVWAGSYRDFHRMAIALLSVAEWTRLDAARVLHLGPRYQMPAQTITLETAS